MKCIEQVIVYIKNLNSKPTKRVEKAAKSVAKKLDDALANGYEIKWQCPSSENGQAVSIVDVTRNTRFVCKINNKQEWIAVFNVFFGFNDTMEGWQGIKFSELDDMIRRWYDAKVE